MEIELNGIKAALTHSQLAQAAKEWEAIQTDKPKVGDWVIAAGKDHIRFGRIARFDSMGEGVTDNGDLIGYLNPNSSRYCRKATPAEVTFFLGLFPERFRA